MELDGQQQHGSMPAFAPREVRESIPSSNGIETPKSAHDDGSKR